MAFIKAEVSGGKQPRIIKLAIDLKLFLGEVIIPEGCVNLKRSSTGKFNLTIT